MIMDNEHIRSWAGHELGCDYAVLKGYSDAVKLHWTTTPPTVEGWYWIKNEWPQRFCAWVTIDGNEIRVGQVGAHWDVKKITHWLGPLPEPEPPQG